jgi:lysophospholipase L1-like esterase
MKKFVLVLVMIGLCASSGAHAARHKQAAPTQTIAPQQTIWTGTWATSPMAVPPAMTAQTPAYPNGATFRDVVRISLGGGALRLRISNEFGATALTLGSVHVAAGAGLDATQPGSDHAVTFGGSETVSIPPGAMAVSDPVAMPVAAFANLAVSIFVPAQPEATLTYHGSALSTNYIAAGNAVTAVALGDAKKVTSWFLLRGVDVDAGADAGAIVAFGDSITDGARSTPDKNARWPDFLAARLQANPATARLGVLDEGIGGNRLLHDVTGPNALARLDRDVLSQSNAKYLVVLLGINDIGRTSVPRQPGDPVTSDQILWALQQIAARAHARGLKVYAATLTPYGGATYQDAAGSKMRDAENAFIRTSNVFDGVIDFDKATLDPAHPDRFLPAYDSGDHLHPNDAGYKAMGDAIDLKLFQ